MYQLHEESVRPHELRQAMNSNEGAILRTRRGMICHWGQSTVTAVFKELWVATLIWLWPDYLREPPSADPHARWCGEGR